MTAASPLAAVRALVRAGRLREAEGELAAFIAATFSLDVAGVEIRRDGYSLNSQNGFVTLADGRSLFFKFHQEEGEEATLEEYYRAELLVEAGFPVTRPVLVSRTPGRQILLYDRIDAPRLADLCKQQEASGDTRLAARLVAAQRQLEEVVLAAYRRSLHLAPPGAWAAEPVQRLFFDRLVEPGAPDVLAGRVARFYFGREIRLPGATLSFEQLAGLRWEIDGRRYAQTLGELFHLAHRRLHPAAHGVYPAVTAHGDAHNANVWLKGDALELFDPAFAGRHVPALLAEVKTTFHNIFAHPLWLYYPAEAQARYRPSCRVEGDTIHATLDWELSPLRRAFLAAKAGLMWRPLLAELKQRGWLGPSWQAILRAALFCCPTLVMDLTAREAPEDPLAHNPASSLIGFAVAVMMGSPPVGGEDALSSFLAEIDPG
ncbi:MAG: hypothetical protein OHK0024_08800 [Thalassobaculales bacterium]